MSTKEKLQRLVFPKGIIYTKKKEAFRTEKVNSIFALIADAAKGSEENKKGTTKALPLFVPISGERGIRTPGSVTFNGFQDRRIRPLCHLSGANVQFECIQPKK